MEFGINNEEFICVWKIKQSNEFPKSIKIIIICIFSDFVCQSFIFQIIVEAECRCVSLPFDFVTIINEIFRR